MQLRRLLIPGLALLLAREGPAQKPPSDHGSIVIVFGREPSTPIPGLLNGSTANSNVADLLFLRLARPGIGLTTANEKSFEPELARSWSRRDSLTLVFELDPRAKWHDGVPVTGKDIVFSFNRARDSILDPEHALLLRYLSSVTAETPARIVMKFRRAYPEQFFDATYHVQPLPAHLVDTIPPAAFATSSFVRQPVGNGPFRWVRRESGQKLELAGNTDFFLGAPKLDRVVILTAGDPDAMMNLMLDGTADAFEAVPQVSGPLRLAAARNLRIELLPSFTVMSLLFNQRAFGDRTRPHPILGDRDVRQAIAMGIDRAPMVRSTYGAYGVMVDAPTAGPHWTRPLAPRGPSYDPAGARALLERRGWTDKDGDGYREKDGVPLTLRLSVVSSSATRLTMAPQVQEQLRQIGVRIEIVRMEGRVYGPRRARGEFDIDFNGPVMDPSPTGIVQSWTCPGRNGSNVGYYCNPGVDSLIDRAIFSTTNSVRNWRAAYTALEHDVPAVFLVSPTTMFAIHTRFRNVTLRPESYYSQLWRWSVDPAHRIARDASGPASR